MDPDAHNRRGRGRDSKSNGNNISPLEIIDLVEDTDDASTADYSPNEHVFDEKMGFDGPLDDVGDILEASDADADAPPPYAVHREAPNQHNGQSVSTDVGQGSAEQIKRTESREFAKASAATGNPKVAKFERRCCFEECDFEEIVTCQGGGHWFCRACLRKHIMELVFEQYKTEFLCMDMSECPSGFGEDQLRQVLSEKEMKKYDEMRCRAALRKAAMEDMCECPKCHYVVCADLSEVVFHCPECDYKSCRKCGGQAHPGILCDQVEAKHKIDGRKIVEEAMSNTAIRTCPKPGCNFNFCKGAGCNKMTCPQCQTFICYVCRKEIPSTVGIKHFCQTSHCQHKRCKRCPLYTHDDKENDRRAIREAGLNAARAVNATTTKKVKVDVDSVLKEPRGRSRRNRLR
ncbi:hypothetical protein ACHAXS_011314 [Conticribra weissflogii]